MQGILLKARFPEAKRVNRPFKRQQSQPHCYVNFFCAPRGLLSVSYNTSPTESLTQCAETTAAAPLKGADRFVWQSHTVTYTHISSDLLFLGCQSFGQDFATLHPTQLSLAWLHFSTLGVRFTGWTGLMFCLACRCEYGGPQLLPAPEEEFIHSSGFYWASQHIQGPQKSQSGAEYCKSPSRKDHDLRVNHSGNHT